MAVVSSDFLQGVLTSFRTLFQTDFAASLNTQGWREISALVNASGQYAVSYSWLGTVPRMEEVTHRQAARQSLNSYNFTMTNREWQSILEVEVAALERDSLGLITPRVSQMSVEAARHPGELVFELVEANPDLTWQTPAGVSLNLGPFFSSGRTLGDSADIDNDIDYTVAGTVPTVEEFQAGISLARGQMRAFQDDRGRPMNLVGNIIMVPPQLEQIAYQSLNVAQAGNLDRAILPVTANGNVTGSGYTVITNPFLTDPLDFYLMHVSGPVNRPFIYQLETAPRFNGGTNPNEQAVIESRKVLYSAYARYNVGVSDPRFAVRVNAA